MIGPIDTPHEFIFLAVLAETLIALSEVNEPYSRPLNVTRSRLTTTEICRTAYSALFMKGVIGLVWGRES